ncbi:DUF3618 domain-containing protein [Nocardia arizonensis]|uniref:DUF3618 domain-containing protein n=1 Tax=Nocardia arizonensis TaxID=1141647 RepID=UPI0006D2751D|nr:DUF3618 domain-containing protein [Nocardia arizonensis]
MNDRPDLPDTPESIRADRDLTREELERTVSELADRVDIPARAEEKLHDTADAARENAAEVRDKVVETAKNAGAQAAHVAPAVGEPLEDIGRHAADSLRRNRFRVAALSAGSAAVVTWIVRSAGSGRPHEMFRRRHRQRRCRDE